jgi:hypothetical protein
MKVKTYTEEQMEDMREMLAQRDMEAWGERDIYDVAMDGCVGYKNMPDNECVEHYEGIWGVLEQH